MYYFLISFSHKNTDIVVRDKISFNSESEQKEILTHLKQDSVINEIMLLSTCNRIEFFGVSFSPKIAIKKVLEELSKKSGLELEYLEKLAFIFEDQNAIYHLFSVVSSLESLVIGETQIVGQLKESFKLAISNNFAGQKISRAIHYGFKASANVRNNTKISTQKVSIASVAVSLAEERTEDIQNKKALVIGSGEISRLVAQYLDSHGMEIVLLNRTKTKAVAIADEVRQANPESKIRVESFVDLSEVFNDFDFIFTATSSETEIIKVRDIQTKEFERFWFDLAVPKDIETLPTDEEFKNIFMFRIDDLEQLVNRNISERENEVRKAHGIIGRLIEDFFNWISSLSIQPILKELYSKAENSAIQEVERAINKKYISENERENIEKIAVQVTKKLLHGVSKRLKATTKSPSFDLIVESMDYLFDLNVVQGGYNAKRKPEHPYQKKTQKEAEVSNAYKCEHMMMREKSFVEEF